LKEQQASFLTGVDLVFKKRQVNSYDAVERKDQKAVVQAEDGQQSVYPQKKQITGDIHIAVYTS